MCFIILFKISFGLCFLCFSIYTVLLGEYVDIQTVVLLLLFQIPISSESPCYAETCISIKENAKITIPTQLLHNPKAHWGGVREVIPVHQVYNIPSHGVGPTVCGAHPI